jgi:hypothetical protein
MNGQQDLPAGKSQHGIVDIAGDMVDIHPLIAETLQYSSDVLQGQAAVRRIIFCNIQSLASQLLFDAEKDTLDAEKDGIRLSKKKSNSHKLIPVTFLKT